MPDERAAFDVDALTDDAASALLAAIAPDVFAGRLDFGFAES